jgi:copper chaperone CopZ
MSTVYLRCKGIYPAGCVTAIEHVLYRQGITHFEYDVSNKHAKVVFDENIVTVDQMLKKIREIGYDVEVAGLDEKDEW